MARRTSNLSLKIPSLIRSRRSAWRRDMCKRLAEHMVLRWVRIRRRRYTNNKKKGKGFILWLRIHRCLGLLGRRGLTHDLHLIILNGKTYCDLVVWQCLEWLLADGPSKPWPWWWLDCPNWDSIVNAVRGKRAILWDEALSCCGKARRSGVKSLFVGRTPYSSGHYKGICTYCADRNLDAEQRFHSDGSSVWLWAQCDLDR